MVTINFILYLPVFYDLVVLKSNELFSLPEVLCNPVSCLMVDLCLDGDLLVDIWGLPRLYYIRAVIFVLGLCCQLLTEAISEGLEYE